MHIVHENMQNLQLWIYNQEIQLFMYHFSFLHYNTFDEFSSSLTPGESVHELYVVDLKLKSSALFVFFADLVFNAVVSVCCEPQRIQLCDFKGSPFLFFSFVFFLLLAVFFVFIQKVQLVCER